MEDIKTNFKKIMEEYNDSLTHSAPKKLSIEFLNETFGDSFFPKKRRLSPGNNDDSLTNASVSETANTSCNSSQNMSASVPPSPWETRRLKADLIESKACINKMKQEIERQHKVRSELEILYESKVEELKKQCDFSSDKVIDLENHMQVLRKREQAAKQELIRTQKEYNQQKHELEEALHEMQRSKLEFEEEARVTENSLNNELSEYRRHTEKLEMELDIASEELSNMREILEDYKERAANYDDLKIQYEKDQQELEEANSRIRELERQIASYDDWKEITEKAQVRLTGIPEREKELQRLKANNRNLHDLLGNKLLLEEQVHDLRSRLEKAENAQADAVSLQVKLSHVEQELKEWVKVAQDHCLPNTLVSPIALRARIEQILQKDIIMASEKNTNMSETKSLESQLQDFKKKCEVYAKNIEDLNVALKRHKTFKERIQKKLLLVSKERDLYKQLLENFEKDLTLTTTIIDASNPDTQMRYRLEMLEKTLSGYKEMCANMEKELTHSRQMSTADQSLETGLNGESYEHFKRDIDALRLDNERLRRRRDELELEMEHRCLKGDFNLSKYKVVHLTHNPAAEAYDNATNIIEKLQAEVERLKRRNMKLEEDNEITTARLNDGLTANIKEMTQLRAELDSTNNKLKKIKEAYKSANMELRDVCYMLFGYRIDRPCSTSNYKISSVYAESPDDYLNFRLTESNVLDMLETPYSVTLKPLIDTHLNGNKSLPVFLSSLTLELFQRTTMTAT